MTGHVKMGLIIGAAIICSTVLWVYFSEHQACIRTMMKAHSLSHDQAERACVLMRQARHN